MMEMRVIPYSSNSAYHNLAVDHALLESVADGNSRAVLRLYSWEPNAVSIGRFQSVERAANVEKCKSMNIDIVRRLSGGGSAYQSKDNGITYSLIAQEAELPEGIPKCYRYTASIVTEALDNLGINTEYIPATDIVANGKVISEMAQTRKDEAVMLHGDILYNADIRKMLSALKTGNDEVTEEMVKSAEEKITDVKTNSHASIEELREALFNSFTRCKVWKESKLTPAEKQRSTELEETVYKNAEWNFNR